ncbi:MAG: oxidoreductase domain protein [Frankiales bacterium]|nr:oxidoreductase domain protein [Frankiales bacterium]
MTPRIALAGAVDGAVLRAAGWQVVGALPLTPYDDLADVPSYSDLDDLLRDESLHAVALDGSDELVARHLPAVLAAGRHVLLIGPAPLDPDLLAAAREAADASGADVAVALVQRWEPWALTVAAALQLVGTPVLQATVRGWPRGADAAVELVDLARSWCGDVVSVTAAPAPLPAAELGEGMPVAWSLLHESGATTLVSHEGAPPLARLSFATARLEAGPLGARWEGGAEIPLLPTPVWETTEPKPATPAGTPYGLLACAVALQEGVRRGELVPGGWPWPADLGDLQAAGRVLAALRESARAESAATVSR